MSHHHSVCEERTFEHVHGQYAAQLRNFLYYKSGDLDVANDLAQESFVKLWQNCSKVVFDKVKSYLFTIGNRLFLDMKDHEKVVLKFEKQADATAEKMQDNPEYVYREQEFKETLENVLGSLSEHQRTVFLMSRIDKMPNKEIAESLDVSVKTVEKHMTSALKAICAQLDELKHFKI